MHHDFEFERDNMLQWRRNIQAVLALLAALAVILAVVAFALTASGAKSDSDEATAASSNIKFFAYKNNLAISGYDVVSYFANAAAEKGLPEYTTKWGGQTWHFVTAEHRDMFLKDPLRYIPQYGGHCAYGVAQGYLVRSEPKAWSIKNNKLYLNYSSNVRTIWLAAADDLLKQSKVHWKKLNAPLKS